MEVAIRNKENKKGVRKCTIIKEKRMEIKWNTVKLQNKCIESKIRRTLEKTRRIWDKIRRIEDKKWRIRGKNKWIIIRKIEDYKN